MLRRAVVATGEHGQVPISGDSGAYYPQFSSSKTLQKYESGGDGGCVQGRTRDDDGVGETDRTAGKHLFKSLCAEWWRAAGLIICVVPFVIVAIHAHVVYTDTRRQIQASVDEARAVAEQACASSSPAAATLICSELRMRAAVDVGRLALELTILEHAGHIPGYDWCVVREHCGYVAINLVNSLPAMVFLVGIALLVCLYRGPCLNSRRAIGRYQRASPLPPPAVCRT